MPNTVMLEQLLQSIQEATHNHDTRKVDADGSLSMLLKTIIDVGVVALSEEDAIEAYNAGTKAMDRVLRRIATKADQVAKGKR